MATASRKKADSVAPEQDPPAEVPPVAPEPEPDDSGKTDAGDTFTILNPGSSAVVYSADARQLAPGERTEVSELDEVGQAALERGYIVKAE